MNPKLIPVAHHMIQANEGYRREKYKDTKEYWTIGFGHNLDVSNKGFDTILLPDAETLFAEDFRLHMKEAETIPAYQSLDDVRKLVLLDMVFQMGKGGALQFKKTLALIQQKEFTSAAIELLDSKYARIDTPARAKRNSLLLKSGFVFDIPVREIAGLSSRQNREKFQRLNCVLLG